MYTTVSQSDFRDAFKAYNRENKFSYEGLGALFDYLEQLQEDTGEPIELDVIALCCEFTEYADIEEIKGVYWDIETLSDLEYNTHVIEFDGGIIIQDF